MRAISSFQCTAALFLAVLLVSGCNSQRVEFDPYISPVILQQRIDSLKLLLKHDPENVALADTFATAVLNLFDFVSLSADRSDDFSDYSEYQHIYLHRQNKAMLLSLDSVLSGVLEKKPVEVSLLKKELSALLYILLENQSGYYIDPVYFFKENETGTYVDKYGTFARRLQLIEPESEEASWGLYIYNLLLCNYSTADSIFGNLSGRSTFSADHQLFIHYPYGTINSMTLALTKIGFRSRLLFKWIYNPAWSSKIRSLQDVFQDVQIYYHGSINLFLLPFTASIYPLMFNETMGNKKFNTYIKPLHNQIQQETYTDRIYSDRIRSIYFHSSTIHDALDTNIRSFVYDTVSYHRLLEQWHYISTKMTYDSAVSRHTRDSMLIIAGPRKDVLPGILESRSYIITSDKGDEVPISYHQYRIEILQQLFKPGDKNYHDSRRSIAAEYAAIKKFNAAIAIMDDIKDQYKDDHTFFIDLQYFYEGSGLYEKALALNTKLERFESVDRSFSLARKGYYLGKIGDWASGEKILSDLEKMYPTFDYPWQLHIRYLLEIKQNHSAGKLFSRYSAIKYSIHPPWMEKWQIDRELNYFRESIAKYGELE